MSGLDGFLAGAKPRKSSTPEPVGVDAPVPASGESGSDPFGVVEIETPSGIQVYYQAGPKRLYRLRQVLQPKAKFANWEEVPSMSTITKILDKPGLVYWAEKVGVNIVQELIRNNWADLEFIAKYVTNEDHDPSWWGGEHLLEIGKTKQLRNWQIKEQAADRGTSVHQALEGWAMSGQLADPDVFPEQDRGYVEGLNAFLRESGFEPTMSEVIVASIEHEVAGRFDLMGEIKKPVELTYHLTPKSQYRKVFQPCSGVIDLKTSKGVYEDHHFQVAGYRGCLVESGYAETDKGFVLRVTRDGRYELVEVQAEWEDFWFLRGLYDSIKRIEERARAAAKKDSK